MKIINANSMGIVQLNAPEAEWIMNAVGMTLAQMQTADKSGKVLLAQKAQFDAQFRGLAVLHEKAKRALHELLPAYNQAVAEAEAKP